MKDLKTMRIFKTLQIAGVTTFCLLLSTLNSSAQNIGINATGATPDSSALLDLNATDKGFLITRVDTASIASPAFGLMTLAPIDSCLYMYSGTAWMSLGGVGTNCGSGSSGNSGGTSFNCGSTLTDARDGKTYGTVEIGNQCWMSENLNHIPSVGNSWCYDDDLARCTVSGRLYDWSTAMDGASTSSNNPSGVQGVCPTGWHLPSDEEWKELEIGLGMTQSQADGIGFRGTDQGASLKSTSFGGNNSSGFTAIAGGTRSDVGVFNNIDTYGIWWTATESGTDAWRRMLAPGPNFVTRLTNGQDFANSVRCIKD